VELPSLAVKSRAMKHELSRTQIDRLGDRLRKGNITDSDLQLLDEYRRSFNEAYEIVAGTIRSQLQLEPTGRPAKSTTSIAEKLRRESIRLTQIQDIAGCRLIVSDFANQERIVASLTELFSNRTVIDRRQKPSHGYRAVHVITVIDKKSVEIQVRTILQQLWAELSEKLSDLMDPTIKYGGGDELIKRILTNASELVASQDELESTTLKAHILHSRLISIPDLTEENRATIMSIREQIDSQKRIAIANREQAHKILQAMIEELVKKP
jgi:ppGpp synthetase/RelA/SpoT-type nucleotidyltranferase